MKALVSKIKRLYKKIRGLFPSALPVGLNEFNRWKDDIASTYSLPTKTESDVSFVLASSLLRLGPQTSYKSKYYFVVTMKAAAAKQIAGHVMYELKSAQEKAAKDAIEAEKNRNAEATANLLAASSGLQK